MTKPAERPTPDVIPIREPEGLSPAERTLWLLQMRPDLLDHVACNLWKETTDLFGMHARAAWDALPADEQQRWKDDALARQRQHIEHPLPDKWQAEANAKSLRATMARNDRAFAKLHSKPPADV